MAQVGDLSTFLNAYGIAVRAGVVTPCIEDEMYVREVFGLPNMPDPVRKDWEKTGFIRKPITLVGANQGQPGALQAAPNQEDDTDVSEET